MDIDQIPRIFDNLLENSIKYAGVCPVEITVRIFEKVSEAPGEPTGVVIRMERQRPRCAGGKTSADL